LVVYARYSKKRRTFNVKMDDPRFTLKVRVKIKKGELDKARADIAKDFLSEMLQEIMTGVSFIQDGKRRIFREYCKARSDALQYIETLDQLKLYEKRRPVPPTIIS